MGIKRRRGAYGKRSNGLAPAIPTLRRLRQEDCCQFESNLGLKIEEERKRRMEGEGEEEGSVVA